MKEVFISYSSADFSPADTLRSVLENNGLSCWMAPRDIPGGSNYTKEIPIAIRNCKVFVLVLSADTQKSHWVLKELDSAVNNGKVILPFMLEDCALNDEFNFLLTGAQRYSAYQKKSEAIETLIGRINGILETSASVKGEQPQEDPQPAVEQPPVYQAAPAAPKPVFSFINEAKCPVCGSSSLTERKGKVTCRGFAEHAAKLWIVGLSLLGMFFGFIIACFIATTFEELLLLITLAGAVAGGIWGNYVYKTTVKRRRIRSGYSTTCYRCNRCQKVFDFYMPLDN